MIPGFAHLILALALGSTRGGEELWTSPGFVPGIITEYNVCKRHFQLPSRSPSSKRRSETKSEPTHNAVAVSTRKHGHKVPMNISTSLLVSCSETHSKGTCEKSEKNYEFAVPQTFPNQKELRPLWISTDSTIW